VRRGRGLLLVHGVRGGCGRAPALGPGFGGARPRAGVHEAGDDAAPTRRRRGQAARHGHPHQGLLERGRDRRPLDRWRRRGRRAQAPPRTPLRRGFHHAARLPHARRAPGGGGAGLARDRQGRGGRRRARPRRAPRRRRRPSRRGTDTPAPQVPVQVPRGTLAFAEHGMAVAAVAKTMLRVSELATQLAVKVLWLVSVVAPSEKVLEDMVLTGAVAKLLGLLHVETPPATKQKTVRMVRINGGFWRQYPCLMFPHRPQGLPEAAGLIGSLLVCLIPTKLYVIRQEIK
jgi:hypothetical protein